MMRVCVKEKLRIGGGTIQLSVLSSQYEATPLHGHSQDALSTTTSRLSPRKQQTT